MRHFSLFISRFLLLLPVLFLIVSCASTDKRDQDAVSIEPLSEVKFKAWYPGTSVEYESINVLLKDADNLISNNAYNASADKLERVLRIKPQYAPAWSRLSWLALQTASPKRAVQMAKRSNSFAYSDVELQLLNWSFVLSASEALNDDDAALHASEKIEALKAR